MGAECGEEEREVTDQQLFDELAQLRRQCAEVVEERDRLRDALHERQRVVDSILDALLIHDFNGRMLDANAAAERLTGYSRDELLSLNLADLGRAPVVKRHLADFYRDGTVSFIGRMRRKNGEVLSVSVYGAVVSREGEGIIQSTTRDMTVLMTTELELRKHQAIVENGNLAWCSSRSMGTCSTSIPWLQGCVACRLWSWRVNRCGRYFHPTCKLVSITCLSGWE